MIAASTRKNASAAIAVPNPPVASLSKPTTYGPTKPARLPTELIQAIPAAAVDPVSTEVDIAQNGPSEPQMPSAASEMLMSASAGTFVCVLSTKPSAATSARAGDVPPPLSVSIGMTTDPDHANRRDDVGQCGRDSDKEIAAAGKALEDLWKPEADAVEPQHDEKIQRTEHPHPRVREDLLDRQVASGVLSGAVRGKPLFQPLPFPIGEPGRVLWSVGKIGERHHAEHDGGQPLEEKQPLPPGQTAQAVHRQQRAGNGAADDAGHGVGRHEERNDPGMITPRKPVGQVQNHAWKNPASASPSRKRSV